MDEETLMDMAAPTPAAQCKNGAIGSQRNAPLVTVGGCLKANKPLFFPVKKENDF